MCERQAAQGKHGICWLDALAAMRLIPGCPPDGGERSRSRVPGASPGSGWVHIAPMTNVHHGDHSGLLIDPVDDPVSPAPRAEPVVQWRKKAFPDTMRLR